MKDLEEKLEAMINGEKKNRSIAIEWLKKVSETLTNPCYNILGDMSRYVGYENFAVAIWSINQNGKKEIHNVYFRYGTHRGNKESETPGFYYKISEDDIALYCGTPLDEILGRDFWNNIQAIKNWIPLLENELEKHSSLRTSLVEHLLV